LGCRFVTDAAMSKQSNDPPRSVNGIGGESCPVRILRCDQEGFPLSSRQEPHMIPSFLPTLALAVLLPAVATAQGGSDPCSTARSISGTGNFRFNNASATSGVEGQGNNACFAYGTRAIERDVWFAWTAPSTGSATVALCGVTSVDTKLAVYDGGGCPSAQALACSDDQCGTQSSVSFAVVAGQSYTIQVGNRPGTVAGVGMITISTQPGTAFLGLDHVPLGSAQLAVLASGRLGVTNLGSSGQDGVSVRLNQATDFCMGFATSGMCAFSSDPNNPTGTAAELAVTGALGTFGANLFFTKVGTTIQLRADFGGFALCNYWTGCLSGVNNNDYCTTYDSTTVEATIPDDACIKEVDWRTWNDLSYGFAIVFDPPTQVTFNGSTNTTDRLTIVPDGAGPQCLVAPTAPTIDTFTLRIATLPSFEIDTEVFAPQPTTGAAFCSGDGSAAACPCGNNGAAGNGCANSVDPNGARLTASGSASVSGDTVVLACSGMPNSSALYFQGTGQQAGGMGVPFGDGLRCASGTVFRLALLVNSAGSSQHPSGSSPSISTQALLIPGNVRTYQVWYRSAAVFCTPSTFNLSNGWELAWTP